ncbi:MAG: cation:proton antiporter regulatory subunit [Aquificaceae bacterium]|nr:cation:proton antiporter regulatory subunit [Aquificaceae bacterium]MDW8237882.1 cation:proton antiporter regulatory subunit [Aquificaceae bacterium]
MNIREADLPGIGKKFSLELRCGLELVLVIYNSGKRELFIQEDGENLINIELTEEESKNLGFILAGALYQPIRQDRMELILKQVVIEWIKVEKGSNFCNKTIADLEIRRKTGASIIVIDRNGDMIPSPDPYKQVILEGDTLIVVGTRNQIQELLKLCGRCST